MLKKLNYILDRRQKVHLFFLLVAFIIGSFLELLGVSAILPWSTSSWTRPCWRQTAPTPCWPGCCRRRTCGILSVKACVALIVVYVLKDVYLLFMYNLQFGYTYKNKARIANNLMGVYMQQDYLELINHNVADLLRSLSTDIDCCFALILALLNILCESFTALALVAYLMIQSPQTMLSLLVIMGLFVLVFTHFYRRRPGCLRRAVPRPGCGAAEMAAADLPRHQGDQGDGPGSSSFTRITPPPTTPMPTPTGSRT